jgi:hypothetical protein
MKKILLSLAILFALFLGIQSQTYASANNLNIWNFKSQGSQVTRNDKLNNIKSWGQFIEVSKGWEKGIFNTLILFARDMKNLFYAVATVFFLIISFKLIVSNNTEEELGKFKKWIIWITVWLVVMQLAFTFTKLIFDKHIWETLAFSLMQNLIEPLINLLMTLTSIFFIAIAIFAFYRLITANGNEEAVKKWKMTILHAIIGFMLVKFARGIVETIYGKIDCNNTDLGIIVIEWGNCINRANLTGWVEIIVTLINWLNGFVGLAVVLMIMYTGSQILLSGGDEEKLKKGKQALIYIAIWLGILAMNYLILTFFLIPQTAI